MIKHYASPNSLEGDFGYARNVIRKLFIYPHLFISQEVKNDKCRNI
jgi:hypothetical protein